MNSLFINGVYKFIYSIFNFVIPIITIPYLYRVIGIENMGIADLGETLHNYFILFSNYGIMYYALRELSCKMDLENLQEKVSNIWFAGTILSLISSTIYYIYLNASLGKNIDVNLFFVFGISIFSHMFFVEWIYESQQKYKFITLKSIILKILYLIAIYIFIKDSNDYNKYILIVSAYFIFNNIIGIIPVIFKGYIKFSYLDLKKVIPYINKFLCIIFINNLYLAIMQINKNYIVQTNNLQELGYYGLVQKIGIVIYGLFLMTSQVTVPMLVNLISQNKNKEYWKKLYEILNIVIMFLIPICVGIILLNKEIIQVFLGDVNFDISSVFILFIVFVSLLIIQMIIFNLVLYINKLEKIMLRISLLTVFLKIFINQVFWNYNILTVRNIVISDIIIFFAINIILIVYIYLRMDMIMTKKIYIIMQYIIVSLIFYPILICIRLYFNNPIIIIIGVAIISCIAYFLILWMIKNQTIRKIFDDYL